MQFDRLAAHDLEQRSGEIRLGQLPQADVRRREPRVDFDCHVGLSEYDIDADVAVQARNAIDGSPGDFSRAKRKIVRDRGRAAEIVEGAVEMLPARGQGESLIRTDQECDAGGLAWDERLDDTIAVLAGETAKRFSRSDPNRAGAPSRLNDPRRREGRRFIGSWPSRWCWNSRGEPVSSQRKFISSESDSIRRRPEQFRS